MANSPLDFPSTQTFRQRLIVRNLAPYPKSPNRPTPPYNFEIIQSDYPVIDSPDQLIDIPTFANRLFPLNQYGSTGGYIQTRDPNRLLNTHSNEGEYGVQDADIINEAGPAANGQNGWRTLNPYGSGTLALIDSATDIASLEIVRINQGRRPNGQPYPTTFVPSFYSPLSILLSPSPTGSNGPMSNDSFIVRLGASLLRQGFEDRIAREITRQTIGRANIANANSGTDVLGLVTGTIPLIEPNYQITIPANPITAAAQLGLSLAGSILPMSVIPGSYFDSSINPGQPTTIQQISNAYNNTIGSTRVGQVVSALFGGGSKTGSQLFLTNTGSGQKSRLFGNLDYNRYKPGYDRNVFDRVAGAIVGTSLNNSNYYIGSTKSEPSNILSPSGELPINEFGQEIKVPVYGPSEISQLYEGTSQVLKLGANGPIYSDGGGIEGGLTWVSPKYKNNAGYHVGPGGDIASQDTDYKESSYGPTESTNFEFKGGSILDDTQRIINSQPQGGRRLQHVGNAIDQVSKVFHDGYKELTKGSRVLSYVGDIGQEKGAEYCRVFAKDTPYLQYNDLQKRDGMTTEGRRFSYSVLDKTYNLNIAPNKMEGGQDSSNLIGGTGNEGHVKKYMFSLENLAWRSSNKPGFTYSDLPICERGPNGGRIMWFPPYDLKFNENVNANWKATDFLGRPEPVYTYNNTSRSGTISWKIVVDHPSVLNLVVNRVLAKETNKEKIDSILESFFAGCRKYDLYELAKKYYTVNPNDLFEIQKELVAGETTTTERISYVKGEVGPTTYTKVATPGTVPVTKEFETKYGGKKLGVYFENDYPKQDGSIDYNNLYTSYTSTNNEKKYKNQNNATTSFFSNVVTAQYNFIKDTMIPELAKLLEDSNTTGTVTITINGSASAPQTVPYNKELSKRRQASLRNFFEEDPRIGKFIGNKLILNTPELGAEGENSQVFVFDSKTKQFNSASTAESCTDGDATSNPSKEIYTTRAMACRRAYISSISVNLQQQKIDYEDVPNKVKDPGVNKKVTQDTRTSPPTEVTRTVLKDNITKRVLRQLLSECDYFEVVKEETPMVYDNLREKLKFFNPAFHSITPEGLNSRLTFLQQSLRPGDTIPVVRTVDGKDQLQYDNASNTAFGTPPVLVLRVGDFFHTKIIPDSLAITYEDLDINPEGIGVQPMIANVSLNFKFIGGQGLAGAVDKLQNALTFNYYANTEMYDERADVTDTSYKVLDKQFLDFFGITVPPPTTNQAKNTNNNGQSNNTTIGNITSTVTTTTDTNGKITYGDFMDRLVSTSQDYFINVFNKSKEVFKQYNNAVLQNWSLERDYKEGSFLSSNTGKSYLFGKPKNIQTKFDKISKDFKTDIDNDVEGLISFMKTKNYPSKVIRQLKDNYKKYIDLKTITIESAITKSTQDFVLIQQNLIMEIGRANVVGYIPLPNGSGMDGYQQKNGSVQVYLISGTTEVDPSSTPVPADTLVEYINDINTLKDSFNSFNDIVTHKYEGGILVYDIDNSDQKFDYIQDIFVPFSQEGRLFLDTSMRRSYFLLSDDIIDGGKYTTFKNSLISNIISNATLFGNSNKDSFAQDFDAYWVVGVADIDSGKPVKTLFLNENSLTETFLTKMENNLKQKYFVFTPFNKKKRVMDYTTYNTEPDPIKNNRSELIKALGLSTNKDNNKTTWNDMKPNEPDVLFSKVKLN